MKSAQSRHKQLPNKIWLFGTLLPAPQPGSMTIDAGKTDLAEFTSPPLFYPVVFLRTVVAAK
jgi:hypothetical protein